MNFTCKHCEVKWTCPMCARERRQDAIFTLIAGTLLVALVIGAMAGYNHLVWDDWQCAFKKCIEVKP